MVAQPGQRTSSMNGGELSREMSGRVDIAVYYAGGLRYKNIEPVPQGGARFIGGTRHIADLPGNNVRFISLDREDQSFHLVFLDGQVRIFNDNDQLLQTISTPEILSAQVPDLNFYAELDTVGVFHRDIESLRFLRQSNGVWTKDKWPYESIPEVDLGGIYPKTDDEWEIHLSFTSEIKQILISFSVNGEETPALLIDGGLNSVRYLNDQAFVDFANIVKDELQALPSLGETISVSLKNRKSLSATFVVAFTGELSGSAYSFDAIVVNTSEAAARSVHTQVGETDAEPLFSSSRGWPGTVELVQDRLVYADIKARPGAMASSEVAEYFRLNIESQSDAGARLDALRSQTGERILKVSEHTYWVAFTTESVWFASNRALSRNSPPNFIRVRKEGIAQGTTPRELERLLYFVDRESSDVYSMEYDQISEGYTPKPESVYSTHLTKGFFRQEVQTTTEENAAGRMWFVRKDGRLILSTTIISQEILNFVEYVIADGGKVKELNVDLKSVVRMAIERDGVLSYERLDPQELLQNSRSFVPDISGVVNGLQMFNGKEVWAIADGYVLGPFTVENNSIDLGNSYQSARIGLWQPVVYESMPHVFVTRDDRIVRRPGRIHTIRVNVIDTTSIAIGANGEEPEDVILQTTEDVVDQPQPSFTGRVDVTGIMGSQVDTTFVITQVRPGFIQIRDVVTEEKL